MLAFFKKQVRLKLKCVKYEWEVGGMWEKVCQKICALCCSHYTNSLQGLKPQDPTYDDEKKSACCLRWVFKGALGFKDSLEAFATSFASPCINEIVMNCVSF